MRIRLASRLRGCPPQRVDNATTKAAVARLMASRRTRCRRFNDAVCVCVGEVRTPADPAQPEPDLVVDVAELIWEPIPD
jgi:NAD(P)-dependent dehydrogenase (short-subunit alcohol dehydrogenase family)